MTNAERILDFISRFPGRDDDEITAALGLSQRQTVNQVARQLEQRGQVRRAPGPTGKIANYPVGPRKPVARTAEPQAPPAMETSAVVVEVAPPIRAPLPPRLLLDGGFAKVSCWRRSGGDDLVLDKPLPKEPGVYAFADREVVLYIGVATMGLAKRLYFYSKPGVSQKTNHRIKALLLERLKTAETIDILTASPPDMTWNDLPISAVAGLEIGLIQTFGPPWNMRSAMSGA
jgi:hypothetical protein